MAAIRPLHRHDEEEDAVERPDFWPDIGRFLIGFALGGVVIGAYTLMNVQPLP